MNHKMINNARAEALFVSQLQRSDQPTPTLVRAEVTQSVRRLGTRGCAALVAYEFGEHPETAVPRMHWAHSQVRYAFAG